MRKIIITVLICFVQFFAAKVALASDPTVINSDINTETTWTPDGNPYVVLGSIQVNAPLIIKPGTIIKFSDVLVNNRKGGLHINSSLLAVGTPSEKIVFTSAKDSSYGGDTLSYSFITPWSKTYARKGDWSSINIYDDPGNIKIENAIIAYATTAISYASNFRDYYKGLYLKNTEIRNNEVGISLSSVEPTLENISLFSNETAIRVYPNYLHRDRFPSIKNSTFYNNFVGVNTRGDRFESAYFDARNNWWGDPSGPHSDRYNPDGKGEIVLGDWSMFNPWLNEEPVFTTQDNCGDTCFSNVLFLPGIKSSRLYKNGLEGTEDKLWPPNYFGNDLTNLALYKDGKSIEQIYTRDAIEEVGIPLVGGNIYRTFFEKLSSLKSDKIINDYESFAYDWRQDVEYIGKNESLYTNGYLKSLIVEIVNLAATSKNQKVTIVAHSNGGLVAKAAMMELEKQGLTDRVDKIVFVGTPQMGTPLAVLSTFYGYDESALFGTLISRSESRTLAENMPGAYGLLPSTKYFERMKNPFINFSSSRTDYERYYRAYGNNIDNVDEFKNFLLGKIDGRNKPKSSDVEKENILNENLLNQAFQMHERLDNWTPPKNIEVIQIAGWGLDTVSGIKYTEKEKTSCMLGTLSFPICGGTGEYEPIYEPEFTVDGDKVVVASSALMLPEAANVKNYWVDLYNYNDNNFIDREHKDIFETNSVKEMLNKIITNKDISSSLPNYINKARPVDYNNAKPRLRMSLYSPLDIHLYDDAGNHTGPKKVMIDGQEKTVFEQGIPNSYYYQFGDRKYVGFPKGGNIHVELDGYDVGSYSLKLEEIKLTETGDKMDGYIFFENLPTTAETKVTFDIPNSGIDESLPLNADVNGDGKKDYTVKSVPNGTAILDVIAPTISILTPESEKQYLNNQILKFDYTVSDNVTDTENIKTEILYDGKFLEDTEIDLSLQNLGNHSLSISAIDEAGNKSVKKIDFSYITDIKAISDNIDHYVQLNLIVDDGIKDFLQVKVSELEHVQDMLEKMNDKTNSNAKNNQIKLLNKKTDDAIYFIQGKLKDKILTPAQEILIQSLSYVKI